MNDTEQDLAFLKQLTARIEEHIAEEQFGVSELAEAMHMSRSNLLRKVKKAGNLSVSQLISQVRLQRAMELLRTTSFNVSEVALKVGYKSTSYFIKCFREYYGYPPGEANKRPDTAPVAPPPERRNTTALIASALASIALIALAWWGYSRMSAPERPALEKSIVVLPFKNDSADSSNVYLINGLMEATLGNLQKIKDLKVLSRTSAEKYRHHQKTAPEIARELQVSYIVEGSGQKIGDRIVLNIQLIDGASDRHLWSKQYRREANNIFDLQQEISKDIATEIQAVITPEEKSRIEKVHTNNPQAYDSYMKGLDLLNQGTKESVTTSLQHFDEAIRLDKQFSLAYAHAGMACYFLDYLRTEKTHLEALGTYADQALLHDPTLGEAFTAKAMYYLLKKEYSQALPYLEKGHEYNPNNAMLLGMLADFHANYLPNTGKYLEYALKGARLKIGEEDSVSQSYFYLRLGNALIQNGFVDEALTYIDRSLEYFDGNAYSRYVRAFVLYAKNGDLRNTRQLLLNEFNKDTTRFDILQDIGKVSYYLRDYDEAYRYYQRFNRMRETLKLDVYIHENMIIGVTYEKAGHPEAAQKLIESYRQFLETDQSAYKHAGLSMYYAHAGDREKSLEHLKLFAREDNIQYWLILFWDQDPIRDNLAGDKACDEVFKQINKKFWTQHEKLKGTLAEQGLLTSN